jgi:hypothetical protein
VIERVKNSLSRVRGLIRIFRVTPQHWRTPCSSRTETHDATSEEIQEELPAEANRDDHHPTQRNETSFVPEPSNTTDQERRAKLEALMKARAEKTAHTQEQPAEQQEFENVDDDDDTIDRELEMVQQKIQQLQKNKEKFAAQL